MTESAKHILALDECSNESFELVGGKALGLFRLLKAGASVPPGFCISTEAFKIFQAESESFATINKELAAFEDNETSREENLFAVSERLKSGIQSSRFSSDLSRELLIAFHELVQKNGRPVAVRSSATLEDTSSLSFAGQHESRLNVKGEENFLKAVKDVWASYYTPRAISYRSCAGLEHSASIAIVVQSMVRSTKSGVLFTASPSTGDRSKMLIEAVWGLGEGLVGGSVTPDQYFVDKVTLEVYKTVVSSKKIAYVPDTQGGVIERELSEEEALRSCLSTGEVQELAITAKKVEKELGQPQDIEWACEEERNHSKMLFLQSRPITTLKEAKSKGESDVYSLVTDTIKKQFSVSK